MHTAERITLTRLPSGVPVETTVHVYEGDADGPTLYVQAAQHGREVNGTEVLRRVHDRLGHDALAGRLVAVPVANPLTFDHVSYVAPAALDPYNANMNRVWPGDDDGSLTQRMAARLWEYVGSADAVVDLHTGSPEMLSHTLFRAGDAESERLASAFGTDLLLAEAADEDAGAEWADRDFHGKLRVAATRAGTPAVTPELGHNRQVVESAVETGVAGVFGVLRRLGMLPGDPDPPADQQVARNHLGRVTATDPGLFLLDDDVELGDEVSVGDRLGRVYDPATYEAIQDVEATHAGVLYSVTAEATVTAGRTLVGVATPVDSPN